MSHESVTNQVLKNSIVIKRAEVKETQIKFPTLWLIGFVILEDYLNFLGVSFLIYQIEIIAPILKGSS